jgi:transcriptional regulator with XRE-family HTH domain
MALKHSHHQHLYTCLGNVISYRRKRLRMSQDELAEESGVDRVFISNNIELNMANVSLALGPLRASLTVWEYAIRDSLETAKSA